ncbi:MAG: hypothetical protein R3C46_04645 [Hyphomonadaceae bacterium]
MAVQSLIAINAGAMLAVPPIVEVFFKESLGFSGALVPMLLFLVGLLAAVACAYAAYFNFQFLSQSYSVELWARLITIEEKSDLETFHRLKGWRANTRADYEKQELKYDKLVQVFFYIANGLGILSLLLFILGSLLFASASLQSGQP